MAPAAIFKERGLGYISLMKQLILLMVAALAVPVWAQSRELNANEINDVFAQAEFAGGPESEHYKIVVQSLEAQGFRPVTPNLMRRPSGEETMEGNAKIHTARRLYEASPVTGADGKMYYPSAVLTVRISPNGYAGVEVREISVRFNRGVPTTGSSSTSGGKI